MNSDQRTVNLTDELIREALKLELESCDIAIPAEAWQRIEDDLNQARVTSRRRPFSWSTLAAAAAVFLVIAIGGMGFYRSMHYGIPAADADMRPAAGEEIAMLQIEDEVADDSIGIMEENGLETTGDLPTMIAEAEFSSAYDEWPPSLGEEYLLSNTVIIDLEDHPPVNGAYYSSNNAELLFARVDSSEIPVSVFIELLAVGIGTLPEIIEDAEGYLYLEALNMPGLVWQDENQYQALIVVFGSLDVSNLKDIASGLK
jgi:hypothetical protein